MATPASELTIDGMESTTVDGSEGFAPMGVAFAPLLGSDHLAVWVTRWRLTPVEKARVQSGEDIFVTVIAPAPCPVAATIGGPPLTRHPRD